ncbi:MAG: hypothetical protein HKN12_09190, partial [Gemmatimonadetes bacterium]|nr:hypothetical protein [Gemmatimonadota bacterium]
MTSLLRIFSSPRAGGARRASVPASVPYAVLAAFLLGGCAALPSGTHPTVARGTYDPYLLPEVEDILPAAIRLRVDEREIVAAQTGEDLLRVRFSFLAYEDYPAAGDAYRSTGTVFFPVGDDGRARRAASDGAVITEFPPGSSRSGIAIFPEYGERPAVEMGVPAAIVDIRGPVLRELRDYINPSSAAGDAFTDEEQFGYGMLAVYQETGNPEDLWEHRIADAWLRAMRAVDEIVGAETGLDRNRFLLVGEGYGALGAAQAAAHDGRVDGLVFCGWPLDWADHHFTRWRRWERRARYYPLEELQPLEYETSRDVLSFLFSSYSRPDPACPSCRGSGEFWRRQYDYYDLWKDRRLEGLATLVIVGDSDPRFPLDLETRVSTDPDALLAAPRRIAPGARLPWGGPGEFGPFSGGRLDLPFRDLRYLRGASSSLANPEAVEAVLSWVQHLSGYRDIPVVRIFEALEAGEVR